MAFKSDFAACGGDQELLNGGGPPDDSPQTVARYPWPAREQATGVFFARSQMRGAEIADGLSTTYFVGEKYVRIREYEAPQKRDLGDDQSALIGDDRDIRRWTAAPPRRDELDLDSPDTFGSRHPSSWNAVFGDGSVRAMSFDIDPLVHRALGNRRDGEPTSAPR
jgi:hypothetical protein